MSGTERLTRAEKEKLLAISEARARGMSSEKILKLRRSKLSELGGIVSERVANRGGTDSFAESVGITPEELRSVCFGLIELDRFHELYPKIEEKLEFKDSLKALLKDKFPFLEKK